MSSRSWPYYVVCVDSRCVQTTFQERCGIILLKTYNIEMVDLAAASDLSGLVKRGLKRNTGDNQNLSTASIAKFNLTASDILLW